MDMKKIKTSALAVVTALAITLSGTFAWSSISQMATNEAMSVANPGGRLHDDFSGYNLAETYTDKVKHIYVENFGGDGDPNIYARVRLDEYMEIGTGAGLAEGDDGYDTKSATSLVSSASINDVTTWTTHIPGVADVAGTDDNNADPFHEYWTWTMTGGSTVYMPTFNVNKDSLSADINGTLEGTNAGDSVYYDDYVKYTTNQDEVDETGTPQVLYQETDTEYSDADDNTVDEYEEGSSIAPGAGGVEGTNYTQTADQTHTARETLDGTVITMATYMAKTEAERTEYVGWVYDTDGWAYWSQAIAPGTATGLLINSVELNKVPSTSWYYAVNAVGQFITAEDAAAFITDSDVSNDAWTLLQSIGVTAETNVALVGETTEDAAASSIAAGGSAIYTAVVTDNKGNAVTEGVSYSWTAANSSGNAISGVELLDSVNAVTVESATEVTSQQVMLTVADTVANGTDIVLTCKVTYNEKTYTMTQTIYVNALGITSITGSETIEAGSKEIYYTDATSDTDADAAASSITWTATDAGGSAITGVSVYRGQLLVESSVADGTEITLTATVGSMTAEKTVTVTADDGVYEVGDLMTLDSLNFIVVAEDAEADKLLLVLDAMSQTHAYNSKVDGAEVMTSWADSEIEEWLNNTESGWLSGKTEIQNSALATTITVRNVDGSMPESDVENQIFLLSEADVYGTSYGGTKTPDTSEYTYGGARLEYFETAEARMGRSTSGDAWSWWLRSPYSSSYVTYVGHFTGVRYSIVPSYLNGVRPALWVSIPNS